jgi:hypothetical protein
MARLVGASNFFSEREKKMNTAGGGNDVWGAARLSEDLSKILLLAC